MSDTTSTTQAAATTDPGDPTPTTAQAATGPADQPNQQQDSNPEDALGDAGKRALHSEREARRQAETDKATTEAKLDAVLTALGLKDDAKDDPAQAVETYKTQAHQARVELAVYQAADAAGADPARLLRDVTFLEAAKNLDPTDTAAIKAAITQTVEDAPWLAKGTTSTTPSPGSRDAGAGAHQNPTGVSEDVAFARNLFNSD